MSTKQCPRCNIQIEASSKRCGGCGYRFEVSSAAAPARTRPSGARGDVSGALQERLASIVSKVIIIAVVAGLGWGIWVGVRKFIDSLDPGHPFPLTRQETATIFFNGLATEDYQSCYNLLESSRRVATVIDSDNRYRYFKNFERIRNYLIERSGEDCFAQMTIDSDTGRIRFPKGIELTLVYEHTRDSRNRDRYGVEMVHEFPIDKAPSLGLEQHYRDIEQAIEGEGVVLEEIDRPGPVVALRQNETPAQRLQRLIESYPRARMLDARHTILETIVRESDPKNGSTLRLLHSIADDKLESIILRNYARSFLTKEKEGA